MCIYTFYEGKYFEPFLLFFCITLQFGISSVFFLCKVFLKYMRCLPIILKMNKNHFHLNPVVCRQDDHYFSRPTVFKLISTWIILFIRDAFDKEKRCKFHVLWESKIGLLERDIKQVFGEFANEITNSLVICSEKRWLWELNEAFFLENWPERSFSC